MEAMATKVVAAEAVAMEAMVAEAVAAEAEAAAAIPVQAVAIALIFKVSPCLAGVLAMLCRSVGRSAYLHETRQL